MSQTEPVRQSGEFPPALSWLAVALVVATVAALSLFDIVPQFHTLKITALNGTTGAGAVGPNGSPQPGVDPNGPPLPGVNVSNGTPVPGVSSGGRPAGSSGSGTPGAPGSSDGGAAKCAPGQNGGATDTGVTGTHIKIASTIVESGIGQSFLGPVPDAMNAVINRVNHAGGICGRSLLPTFNDDGWDPSRGQGYINNYIHNGYFALTVVPSSEGLKAASDTKLIDNAGIPVVGSDGMLSQQYLDPMIWPVATSTVSTAHISASYSFNTFHPRSFGIVYDSKYHFGREGAYAYDQAVKRLTGSDINGYNTSNQCGGAFCAISSDNTDFKSAINTFNGACHPCDVVFLLLEPAVAQTFLNQDSSTFATHLQAAQPLFNTDFAKAACGQRCAGMMVWSSYKPPIGQFGFDPAVVKYVKELSSVAPRDDPDNAFTEGGWLGMELFVQALQGVGPNLTRAALKTQLNSMTLATGLTQPLNWSSSHLANQWMLGFSDNYTGNFNGWRYENTDWVKDPYLGQDLNSPF
ncbi:MAG: hypothetical protein NVS3B24_04020 [Candidatus Dormibacteria bacterium]